MFKCAAMIYKRVSHTCVQFMKVLTDFLFFFFLFLKKGFATPFLKGGSDI